MSQLVTNEEADAYFATRMDSDLWDAITEAEKTKALTQASRILLRFRYKSTDWPQQFYDACCEIAYALVDGINPEIEKQLLGTKSANVSGMSIGLSDSYKEHVIAGVPSATAWSWIKPLIVDVSTFYIRS